MSLGESMQFDREVGLYLEEFVLENRVRRIWDSFVESVVEFGKMIEVGLGRKIWEVLFDGEVKIVFFFFKSYFFDFFIQFVMYSDKCKISEESEMLDYGVYDCNLKISIFYVGDLFL